MMRLRLIASSMAALAALAAFAAGCSREKPGEPVITVNSRVITRAEFRESLNEFIGEGGGEMSPDELMDIKREFARMLVEEALIAQQAEQLGITATDADVATEEESFRKLAGEEEFKEAASRPGWKGGIKKRIVIRKVLDAVSGTKTLVSTWEAGRYYDEHPEEFARPERARARMIVVATEEEASNIRKTLTQKNFEETARRLSLSPDKAEGGDTGYFGPGEMPAEFEEAVFALKKKGEISPVVKTGYGYHIFMLVDRQKGGRVPFADVKDRIMESLEEKKIEGELASLLAALKSTASIEVREDQL